jgi:hypothetical protein
VVGKIVRALVEGVVLCFAALAFFLVPLRGKTAAQHVVAIVRTREVREARRALGDAARRAAVRAEAHLIDVAHDLGARTPADEPPPR